MSARIHRLSDVLRIALIGTGLVFAAASSGSSQSASSTTPAAEFGSPAPRAMQPDRAIGLWKTSFGPVKIEIDPEAGGPNGVQGAWRYMQGRREVIGVFWGSLRGNVLDFEWHEPGDDTELRGQGYLVFDVTGERFNGKWWTTRRDKSGDWNGWRPAGATPAPDGDEPYDDEGYDDEGGEPYDDGAGAPPPPPY